jgi:hypothetical protein
MDQDSTETAQRADMHSRSPLKESRIEHCLAELSLSFGTTGDTRRYRLSIEAPTYRDARGILQAASVSLFNTASRDPLNGDSDDRTN